MTFSRRAAAEITRRAARIARTATGRGRDPGQPKARWPRCDGGRRRRPVDLCLSAPPRSATSSSSASLRAGGAGHRPGAELPLDPRDPRCGKRRAGRGRGGLRQGPVGQPAQRGQAGARYRARRQWSGRLYLPRNPGRSGGGIDLQQQAVLFRSAFHSAGLEVELTRRNIPFVNYGGLKFLDAAHVKDVLACLRLAQNPNDRIAGFRTLQLLPGTGPSTAEALVQAMSGVPEPARALEEASVPARAAADWPAFVALYGGLKSDAPAWPAQLEGVRAWYELPPTLRTLRYETCGMLWTPPAERSGLSLVCGNPHISWTRAPRSTLACVRGQPAGPERAIQTLSSREPASAARTSRRSRWRFSIPAARDWTCTRTPWWRRCA